MSIEIKVPALPESVADATILQWHKAPGEPIKRDENMVDLETDKIVLEVPAPADGTIKEIKSEVGAVVSDNDLLCVFEAGEIASASEAAAEQTQTDDGDAAYGLAVKTLLAEHNLSASQVKATGSGGRILKEDVLNHLNTKQAAPAAPATPAAVPAPAKAPATTKMNLNSEREEVREPMSRLRQTIAKRLVNAQQTSAMLTTFNEADMIGVMNLRKKYKDTFLEQHESKLGFMSFFVKATVAALQKYPMVNAHIDGTDIIRANYCDIGIAVSSPRGLVVPILRDAQNSGFADIETNIRDFGSRAQTGSLKMEELTGGTFTITNGGTFGSLLSTPILNPPQSAILGMHAIQQRPVAVNGEVVIRPMMYLALSYDHRIVDGKEAVQFLVSIKESIEDPTRLLLELN
ncbi:MAG: 2-oxoglutarate dehydrogenase E2 component (dihydrolipoamide succinyltransferase) [Saprospiraceae bacterium]|jgi:2-oxoglutarate dehydrogenase E2 component (dihydrolipoamide succinyltransferase)